MSHPAAPIRPATEAPSGPALAVEGLVVEFPALQRPPVIAINRLDLAIAPGEIVGLVGESGAGKTTLARSLLGLPPAPGRITAGRVLFEGRDILRMPEAQIRRLRGHTLSMIVPNPRGELNPLLPVGDQIATVARVHLGIGRQEARTMALEMLKAVQIPDPAARMHAFPHELSGGMAQRVVIAIALICSPRFIVSDDATSGLDVTVQGQILAMLRELAARRGSAMLFITRDMGITAHFCDRIAVIYRGEIMELAPRDDFFFRPRHPTTIMLMAAFTHNQALRRLWSSPAVDPARGDIGRWLPLCRPMSPGPGEVQKRRSAPATAFGRSFRALSFSGRAMIPLLDIIELTKHFPIAGSRKQVQAVNGVSIAIQPGETVGLVGESGSGKTTVGRCVVGLADLSGGQINFEGHDLEAIRRTKPKSLLGQIQVVFQEPTEQLDPRFTVAQSVEEPLRSLGVSVTERNERVAETLDLVNLPAHVGKSYPAELSAGQQQRVGIARAMITNPKLLVLDEPTSALDPSARAEVIALLMRIQRQRGTAYLFISHDLGTVRFISHRVAVMYLGMIVEQGPAASVFARARHPYSVALLASVLLPNPRLRATTSIRLEGEIPSPIDLPRGCFLASRCPLAIDACRSVPPPPEIVGKDHIVHCIRHAEVGQMAVESDVFGDFQREAERILRVGAPVGSEERP